MNRRDFLKKVLGGVVAVVVYKLKVASSVIKEQGEIYRIGMNVGPGRSTYYLDGQEVPIVDVDSVLWYKNYDKYGGSV